MIIYLYILIGVILYVAVGLFIAASFVSELEGREDEEVLLVSTIFIWPIIAVFFLFTRCGRIVSYLVKQLSRFIKHLSRQLFGMREVDK